jgi:hypothetical protein
VRAATTRLRPILMTSIGSFPWRSALASVDRLKTPLPLCPDVPRRPFAPGSGPMASGSWSRPIARPSRETNVHSGLAQPVQHLEPEPPCTANAL